METQTLPRDGDMRPSPERLWEIDPSHSTIGFSIKHMMFATVHGRFGGFRGTIRFDRDRPDDAEVEVEIDAATIDTGITKRDDHLRSADFFDVATYPTITFRSTRVEPVQPVRRDRWLVVGDLTMSGVTRSVELAVEQTGEPSNHFADVDRVHGDGEDQPQGLRHDVQPAARRRRARGRRRGQDRDRRPGEQGSVVATSTSNLFRPARYHEQEDSMNTNTPDTIVLIHGLWMTPRSWEHWIEHYERPRLPRARPGLPRLRGRGRGAARRPVADRGA